ncbi:DUF4019 domain-containing protein [Alteromonas sp. CYL-A6]|uniref:DUF4019 domain-containing protein n=1 Tax=Alteromonas nitratireducens TaxID=3390813 RepID=UPI0034B92C9F
MRNLYKSLVASLLLTLAFVAQADPGEASMTQWLSLVDAGQYQESWEASSPFFQQQISADKWQQALTMVRAPLGAVESREIAARQAVDNIPGAPAGSYVVYTLNTAFANMPSATETITIVEDNASWKVVGYFIR